MSSGLVQIGHSVTSLLPNKTRPSVQIHSPARSNLNHKIFDACHRLTVNGRGNKFGDDSQSHLHYQQQQQQQQQHCSPQPPPPPLSWPCLPRMSHESAKSWFPCGPARKSVEAKTRSTLTTRSAVGTGPNSVESATGPVGTTTTTTTTITRSTGSMVTTTTTTIDNTTPTGPVWTGSKCKQVSNPWCTTESEWPECRVPQPVFALFIYLAQRGVHVNDLFRRPGNITQMKHILQQFATGHPINWSEYNVYTVANVAKKVLLAIPGGLLGPSGEKKLLATASFATVAEAEAASEQVYRLDPTISKGRCRLAKDPGGRFAPGSVARETGGTTASWVRKPFLVPVLAGHLAASPVDDPCHAIADASWPRGSVQQLDQVSEVAERRIAVFLRILDGLPPSHRQLAILVFGILHQMVFHAASTAERSGLTSPGESPNSDPDLEPRVPLLTIAEGVVKSVAGTLFHTCAASVLSVEQTAQVLRSLVLCFPALGEPVTQFYANAVHGHLRFAPLIGTGMTMEKATCALCPKSAHSTYFGPHDSPNGNSRSCPFSLLQVASRIFCLTASSTQSSDSGSPTHTQTLLGGNSSTTGKFHLNTTCTTTAAVGTTPTHRNRLRCPPLFGKSHDPPVSSVLRSSTPRHGSKKSSDGITRTPSPASRQHSYDVVVTKTTNKGETKTTSTVQSRPCSTPSMDDDQLAPIIHPPVKIQIDAATEPKHITTIRRHQSRYRSFRRRQMENLSRRAEWFLAPTTIPAVNITPILTQPGLWDQPDVVHSAIDISLYPQSCQKAKDQQQQLQSHDIVVTSTVSLLELGHSIDPDSLSQGDRCCLPVQDRLGVTPPRMFFTASTGELEQGDGGEQFGVMESLNHHATSSHRPDSGGNRQRLLSVGSCLTPFPSTSFVSIHSAPSADFSRVILSNRADYFHSSNLPPSIPIRSSGSADCQDEIELCKQSGPSTTSLQRPLLVGGQFRHYPDDYCPQYPQIPTLTTGSATTGTVVRQMTVSSTQKPNVLSCSALPSVKPDVNWPSDSSPTDIPYPNSSSTRAQAHSHVSTMTARLRRNSDLTALSPISITVTTDPSSDITYAPLERK